MTDILEEGYAETPEFQDSYRRCFWLVDDDSRPCKRNGTRPYGHMAFCHVHGEKFLDSILIEIRENPTFRDGLIGRVALHDREEGALWSEHRKEVGEWPMPYRRAHCVYFVERDGFVKIGRTSNVKKRMHEIGKGSSMPQGMSVGPVRLLAVIHCACTTPRCVRETFFHDKFRHIWLEDEWFLLDNELASFIGGLEDCLEDHLREVSAPVSRAAGEPQPAA